MSYTVSRQSYYYSKQSVVEIAKGSIDYVGSDALAPKYRGEMETYADPREALKVANEICNAWKKDRPDLNIFVVAGDTGGMGIELADEDSSGEDLTNWAEKEYNNLPKCCRCGDVLGTETFRLIDFEDEVFCSENCANLFVEDIQKEEEEEEEEEVNEDDDE